MVPGFLGPRSAKRKRGSYVTRTLLAFGAIFPAPDHAFRLHNRGMIEPHLLHDFLKRAQGGDRQAMDQLLAVLRPHLEQLARRHADPDCVSESTADLVQEAALRIWLKLEQFRGGEDPEQTTAMFLDWVKQLVGHLGLDRQRAHHAQRREPSQRLLRLDAGQGSEASSTGGIDPAAGGPTPSANAGLEEQAQRIRAALEKLPQATDREIMQLCFFEGLSLRQIAERLQLSYDKVRERYHCSLKALQRELGDSP
jgi:RNA polymerase sigma factor (sigma-70 family)